MFEHRRQRPISLTAFLWRQLRHFGMATAIVGLSLAMGTVGYHVFESLPWIDALLNASMILSGMGPVEHPETALGKLFASAYAIYSGIVFLVTVGVLFAPMVHRALHRFHLEMEAEDAEQSPLDRGR